MIGYKAIHLVPENGNIIELETIWSETGTDINYHKSTPNFIVSRYVSIVNVTKKIHMLIQKAKVDFL